MKSLVISVLKTVLVWPIHMYQKWISPMFPPRCKYYPSCSSYAITAISTHGLKGIAMAAWRLLRCNPWSYGGVDYVKPKKEDCSREPSHHNDSTESFKSFISEDAI